MSMHVRMPMRMLLVLLVLLVLLQVLSLLQVIVVPTTCVAVPVPVAAASSAASPPLPFPMPLALPQTVYRIDYSNRALDDQLTLLTLQGCLNRLALTATTADDFPLLYKTLGAANTSTDATWAFWRFYTQQYSGRIEFREDYAESDVADIVKLFATSIRGYYLANYSQASGTEADNVNAAISMASITDGAIVTTPTYQPVMQALGIPLVQDMRAFNETTFLYQFAPLNTSALAPKWPFAHQFIASQTPDKAANCLTDWSMMASVVMLHHIPTATAVLSLVPEGELFGWVGWTADTWGESDMTRTVSIAGGMVWASDVSNNLGTHAFFRDPLSLPPAPALPNNKGKHTVAFVFTDGDSLAVDADGNLDDNHWRSPDRGSFPLSFGVDPSLAYLAPSIIDYYYTSATANDSIVAFAPGYAYPSYMTNEQVWAWADAAGTTMGAAGMGVTYYIDFNYSSQYFGPLLEQSAVDAAVYFDYPNYYVLTNGRNGSVTWVNDKPCIAIRDSLWKGHSTPASIAAELNQLSTDPTSIDGYSVIAVHLWSQTVDTVKQVVDALGDDVLVVRTEELVALMKANVPHERRVVAEAPQRPRGVQEVVSA